MEVVLFRVYMFLCRPLSTLLPQVIEGVSQIKPDIYGGFGVKRPIRKFDPNGFQESGRGNTNIYLGATERSPPQPAGCQLEDELRSEDVGENPCTNLLLRKYCMQGYADSFHGVNTGVQYDGSPEFRNSFSSDGW